MRGEARDPLATEGGFVLVAVLWAIVLIVGVCALFVNVVGLSVQSGAAFERNAMAEAEADGAIRLVAYHLAAGPPLGADAAIPPNGAWRACRLSADVAARVSVQDQDGLVDLNRAPASLLEAALGGVAPELAGRILAAIGAKRQAAAAPLALGALGAGHAFVSPEELLGALGDGGREWDILARFTTQSGSDGFDPRAAPPALLAAFGPGEAPAEWVRPSRSRIYAVTAIVGERSRGRSARRAVIELIRRPDLPFEIHEWRSVSAPADAPNALAGSGPAAQASLQAC